MRRLRRPLTLIAALVVTLDLWAALPSATAMTAPRSTAEQGSGCFVPQLHGLRIPTAKIELEWANCSLGKVTYKHTGRRLRGVVIAQSKAPGTYAVALSPVGITVGSKRDGQRGH
ncbi:PASTA domain-containing protein [Nocardioides sp. CN2-186]|uniref:PASTA domain-containing protein n=1 Tax=Nocardioides tweenelious TaxID=3156607 RepID=UPI0032B3546A